MRTRYALAAILLAFSLPAYAQVDSGSGGTPPDPGDPGHGTPGGTAVIAGNVKTPDVSMRGGVMVYAVSRDSVSMGMGMAFPDSAGAYRIEGLAAGTYVVGTRSPDLAPQWWAFAANESDATPVDVADGQIVEGIDFALEPLFHGTASISGRVVDENGHPVYGAFVQAYDPAGGATWPGWATTDFDGTYSIRGLQAAAYVVRAEAWARWSSVVRWFDGAAEESLATPVALADGEARAAVDFLLPLVGGSASVAGTVTDAAGEPLGGAQVLVQSALGGREPAGWGYVNAWTTADSSGAWLVDGLPTGTYTVYAAWWDGDRFGQRWYDGADDPAAATPITLLDGETRTGLNVVLDVRYLYGSITGVVTDAMTGAPVERALVQARPRSADLSMAPIRMPDSHAITGPDGRFEIGGLPLGEYLVSAHVDGGFAYVGGAWVPSLATWVTVEGGASTDASIAVERRREGSGRLEGRVEIDFSVSWADSLYGDAGVPPKIAVVEARPTVVAQVWPQSERFYSTVVREDGTYALDGLPDGEYTVSAFAPWFLPEYWKDTFDPSAATPVTVDASSAATGIDFALVPWMFVDPAGTVREGGAAVHGTVADESGRPVEGATVYLLDENGDAVASTTTAADGTWALPGVSRGRYRVMVAKDGYATSFNDDATRAADAPPVENAGAGAEINVTLRGSSSTDTEPRPEVPAGFTLLGNYPNPFNPVTTIAFELTRAAAVSVEVFDLLGRRVLSLPDAGFPAGASTLALDASDLPTGVYVYRVTARSAGLEQRATGRMLLVK